MRKKLLPNEQVIVRTRAHASRLVGPAIVTVLIPTAAGLALAWIADGTWGGELAFWKSPARFAVLVAAALILVFYCARRYFSWLSTSYVLTSARLRMKSGVMLRARQEIPLWAVQNVSVRQGMLARMIGYGSMTLMLTVEGPVRMNHVRQVHQFEGLVMSAVRDARASEQPSGGAAWNGGYYGG